MLCDDYILRFRMYTSRRGRRGTRGRAELTARSVTQPAVTCDDAGPQRAFTLHIDSRCNSIDLRSLNAHHYSTNFRGILIFLLSNSRVFCVIFCDLGFFLSVSNVPSNFGELLYILISGYLLVDLE